MKNFSKVILIILAACCFVACSTIKDTPKQGGAKAQLLNQENVPFSSLAFLSAAKKGNIKQLNLFLEAGMDVNVHNNGTALTCAVYGDHLESVKFLLENGADVNEAAYWGTPLGIASYKGYYKIAELLLKHGADVDIVSRNDMSPLFNAVLMKGRSKIVDLLLKNGADPNFKQDVTRETPLIVAAGKGNLEIVNSLIKGGSDINYLDSGIYQL